MRQAELATLLGDHLRRNPDIGSKELVKLTYLMIHLRNWKQVPMHAMITARTEGNKGGVGPSSALGPASAAVAGNTDINELVLKMESKQRKRRMAETLEEESE